MRTGLCHMQTPVVVITGASRGLGKSMAVHFAQKGHKVVVAARTLSELEQTAEQVRLLGGEALAVATDISCEVQVQRMVEIALNSFGRIDVLVNNAGISWWSSVEELAVDKWDEIMAVNLRGAFLCSKAVIPAMRDQGGGHIVFVSSAAGRRGLANRAAYSASKSGLIAFAETLATEVLPHRIKVTLVSPGDLDTTFTRHYPTGAHDQGQRALLSPDDVATTVVNVITGSSGGFCVTDLVVRPLW